MYQPFVLASRRGSEAGDVQKKYLTVKSRLELIVKLTRSIHIVNVVYLAADTLDKTY